MSKRGKEERSRGRKSDYPLPKPGTLPPPTGPFVGLAWDWETHGRLSQALVAFGMGAGPIRVTTAAILWYYGKLWSHFRTETSPKDGKRLEWFDESDFKYHGGKKSQYLNCAAQVLDLSRSVGRLAADSATDAGKFAIGPEHVRDALKKFTDSYKTESIAGAYCIDERPKRKKP